MKLFMKTLMNVTFAGVMSSLLACGGQAPDTGQATAALTTPTYSDISSFVACLHTITKASPTVADAVPCVPSGCYFTVTLSEESAQPACTLRDGTRLPRVIFSCPGTGGSQALRFRPSFSLCTQGGIINHIEVGEDVNKSNGSDDPEVRAFPFVQKMADIDSPPDVPSFQAVVDTKSPPKNLGCAECHDRKGTLTTAGTIFNLFGPIRPELADGTIWTNDPAVVTPAVQTPLSVICAGIASSSQLARNPSRQALAASLCNALATH